MVSKIINMAEKLKDEADRKLEAMFRTEPVRDGGFSVQIVRKVRRQIWIRRLSLPIAITLGLLLAAKPLAQLIGIVPNLLAAVPMNVGGFDSETLANLPQLSTVITGLMLLGAVMMISRMLED